MSSRSYRVVSRSSLDDNRRPRFSFWLGLSLSCNALLILVWLLSRSSVPDPPSDIQWQGALKASTLDISQLNKDLQATAAKLQAAKQSLAHADAAQTTPAPTKIDLRQFSATQEEASTPLAWLAIGIPTVPRHNNTDYLTPTLQHLLSELPIDPTDPFFDKVRVIVMNNKPGQHKVYAKVQRRIQQGAHDKDDTFAQKARQYVEFLDNPGTVEDPAPLDKPEPDDHNNPMNIPGREVRKQTCDLIELMETAQPLAHYYLFMEDDFRMCPHTMRLLPYIVAKLNAMPSLPTTHWLGLRISYGMNGILLKSEDLKVFAKYMRTRIERLPPDLIWLEWFSGHGPRTLANRRRPIAAYKYNLLEHIGTVSSFTVRVDRPSFPGCYESMADVWSIAKNERFQDKKCHGSDISPCVIGPDADDWMQIPFGSFEAMKTLPA